MFFLRDVLGSNVAVRGGNLKEKKAGGVLGGRAQRLPPRCIGCLCMCCFFPSVLSSSSSSSCGFSS